MALSTSWAICAVWLGIVSVFTLREVVLYRRDQRSRTDLYPYTKSRLIVRGAISALLAAEGLLLFPGRHLLSPGRPLWFVGYVGLVAVLALIMVLLALLDFRESRRLHEVSEKRLLEEFIHELQQGEEPPPRH